MEGLCKKETLTMVENYMHEKRTMGMDEHNSRMNSLVAMTD